MSLGYYDASVGVFLPMLGHAGGFLGKAARFAEARGLPPSALLGARLAPDMFPLSRQVQIAIDGARGTAARLARLPIPDPEAPDFAVFNRGDDRAFAPEATSFPELASRIEAGRADLAAMSREAIDAEGEDAIVVQMHGTTRIFERQAFLLRYALPNFYFHLSAAYSILRQAGVELGKDDFEGPPVYRVGSASVG